MNIALVTDVLSGGGAESVVCRLAAALAARGHRISVWCLKSAGSEREPLRRCGVTVREPHFGGRLSFARQMLAWLRTDHIDVVAAHNCAAFVWTLPIALCLGIPTLHVWHGALLGPASRYRRLARGLDRLAARVVAVSQADWRALPRGRVRQRAVHIPNGVDFDPLPPARSRALLAELCGRPLPGPVVLAVGTICPEKDVCGLLHGLALLRRRTPEATLVWVGGRRGENYARQVTRTVAELRLDDRVIFAGPFPEAWRLMSGADVFCLSSVTEARPNVIVEAMSQRVPIVATAVGDVGELHPTRRRFAEPLLRHRETALLVPPADPQALANALHAALSDRVAARRRAERAYAQQRAQYTLTRVAHDYERLYAECLRRRLPRPPGRRRPAVLMVGPDARQLGGINGVIDTLMVSPLRDDFRLRRFAHSSADRAGTAPKPGIVGRVGSTIRGLLRHGGDLLRLFAAVRRHRARIVHIHTCSFASFYRSLLDLLAARLGGARVVLHIHGGRFVAFCAGAGRLARRLIRRGAETADAVVVLSERWRNVLRPHLGWARIEVIPNGVAVADRQPAPEAGKRNERCRFVFLGALRAEKGVNELLAAAGRLRRRRVPFELVLAGPRGPEKVDYARAVSAAGLDPVVRVVGPVRGADKARLLAGADCLVLPSHAEGLPLVVLEAAAAGLPVIATPVGDIPELLRGAGDAGPSAPLVPVGDAAALARAMARLATDPALRRALGRRLHAHVAANCSATLQARRVADLYRALLAEPPRAASEWLVGNLLYPLHERLRRRATLRQAAELGRLLAAGCDEVRRQCAARLTDLLRFCAANLPYYRDLFERCDVRPDAADPMAELARLPILDKAQVRANAARMIWRDAPGGMFACRSGGTSGDTLHFFVDRQRQARTLGARLFMQSLFGIRPGDRRAYLWGSPVECRNSWVRRWRDRLLNEIVLDAFDMSPTQMDAHLRRLLHFRPRLLYGYPSAVALLAAHARRRRLNPRAFRWLRLVVLTGEEVHREQIAVVRAAFGCRVISEYGSREVGLIAHECPHGRLHLLTPDVWTEVLCDDRPAEPGQIGEIVCTSLTNRAQPLLRYRLGDVGALPGETCPCGLPLSCLQMVGGRLTGFVALRDGRLCHGAAISRILREQPGVTHFKTYQRSLGRFEVLLVVDQRFDPSTIERVRQQFRQMFGPDVQVDCRIVDHIPPDPSGKRRYVVSDVVGSSLALVAQPEAGQVAALPNEAQDAGGGFEPVGTQQRG